MTKKTNTEYKNDFAKENYDRIIVTAKKGIKPIWEKHAKTKGLSLNAFIHEAVNKHIKSLEETQVEDKPTEDTPTDT